MTAQPLPDTHPDAMRHTYRAIRQLQAAGVMTEADAYELVHVCIELGKLGYVLNDDESDWILKEDNHANE